MSTPDPSPTPSNDRLFTRAGDRYLFLDRSEGIELEAARLRRERHEVHGELTVRVNGEFPRARTMDGVLLSGSFNYSSTQARERTAKTIATRAHKDSIDWFGLLESFALQILAAEREGAPALDLADVDTEPDEIRHWDVASIPLLKDLPMIIYGSRGAGKSFLAMYVAGSLAARDEVPLYCDWEFSQKDHALRFGRLFQPRPRGLKYLACDKPLTQEVDRIARQLREQRCTYLICDSISFALGGPADEEHAAEYFRAVRALKIGSLHIAHTPKGDDEEKTVFGSSFFENGARSIWYAQAAERNKDGELLFGLFHKKSNTSALLKPRGYRLTFTKGRTELEAVDPREHAELALRLPLPDRMQMALKLKPLTVSELAAELGITVPATKKALMRFRTLFVRIPSVSGKGPDRVGLAGDDDLAF